MRVTESNLTLLAKAVEAVTHDEQVTRTRVQALEHGLTSLAGEAGGILGRGFWGRLRWLLTGR